MTREEAVEELYMIIENQYRSRKAVLDMATTIQTDDYSGNEIMEVVDIDDVKSLPPVTPTRKKGKWIVEDSGNYNGHYSCCYCSNCKDYYTRAWKDMKYCPNCGAEMESEE